MSRVKSESIVVRPAPYAVAPRPIKVQDHAVDCQSISNRETDDDIISSMVSTIDSLLLRRCTDIPTNTTCLHDACTGVPLSVDTTLRREIHQAWSVVYDEAKTSLDQRARAQAEYFAKQDALETLKKACARFGLKVANFRYNRMYETASATTLSPPNTTRSTTQTLFMSASNYTPNELDALAAYFPGDYKALKRANKQQQPLPRPADTLDSLGAALGRLLVYASFGDMNTTWSWTAFMSEGEKQRRGRILAMLCHACLARSNASFERAQVRQAERDRQRLQKQRRTYVTAEQLGVPFL